MLNTDALKHSLETLILGQHLPPWACCCGALSKGEAVAVGIQGPHEGGYPQFAGMWHHWQVQMRELDKPDGYQYSVGISRFLEREQMEQLFAEADQ